MSEINVNKRDFSGLVEVHGMINLSQFYYRGGRSDADTVKIELTVESVRFRVDEQTPWLENLEVFGEGYVRGNPVIDSQNRITVRLQGVDAPELHYHAKRGIPEKDMTDDQRKNWKNKEFRQWGSAVATWKLATFLNAYEEALGLGIVKAIAFSKVDSPSDVFDIYGRFVGDIIIPKAPRKNSNINQWLAREGWTFPSFYNSMSNDEIMSLMNISKKAKVAQSGVWRIYSDVLLPFDTNLYLPGKSEPFVDVLKDNGKVNPPKIFRRQVLYEVNHRAGIYKESTLKKYLAKSKDKDYYFNTNDFLNDDVHAKKQKLEDILEANGKIKLEPWDIVFEEKPAELKDWNNKKIDSWY